MMTGTLGISAGTVCYQINNSAAVAELIVVPVGRDHVKQHVTDKFLLGNYNLMLERLWLAIQVTKSTA